MKIVSHLVASLFLHLFLCVLLFNSLVGKSHAETFRYRGASSLTEINAKIKRDPHSASAYIERADARRSGLDQEGAIEDADKALSLTPDNADAYLIRGRSYGDLEKWDLAIADLKKAISLAPNNQTARAELGQLYDAVRRDKEAYQVWDQLANLPDLEKTLQYTVSDKKISAMIRLHDLPGALKFADKKVKESNGQRFLFERAKVFMALKQFDKALADVNVELKRSNTERATMSFLRMRSDIFKALGKKNLSQQDAAQARKLEQHNIDTVPFRSGK